MAETRPGANPLFLRDEELRHALDLLFFAARDLAAEADAALEEKGLGRAHHRALYFIGRQPGLTVGELMGLLGITKQSLGRVLKELIAEGWVSQTTGTKDRRERRLALTPAGQALEQTSTAPQRSLVAKAFRTAGADAVNGFLTVLSGLRQS
jgi:DNA-binding MarR family transcriptional regulator